MYSILLAVKQSRDQADEDAVSLEVVGCKSKIGPLDRFIIQEI